MLIKVCGMREAHNIRELLEEVEIDFIGFIFYHKSPRYVSDNEEYINAIRSCGKQKVGVFVDESLETILEKADKYGLDCIQLHGNESPALCRVLRKVNRLLEDRTTVNPAHYTLRHGALYKVIKAFHIASTEDLTATTPYTACVDYYLFDTKSPDYGGSGRRFDWSILDAYDGDTPFLLSGGISHDSLDDLKKIHHPKFAGVDLNSGFEIAPAHKDVARLKSFIQHLKPKKENL
ncbi:MAG: phosphoribosylanthranilate isomerase [Tannerella sp.]|jgi:phosphoribosylanthranilate isomerase|nr:phosphoribosylanthranilate isomerase [Tannerella sp.]